jgi:uncharacterized membrane protein YoaK (UPF0700 family)
MTDAIGFMASGDFVSFMSGNTTRLAVAISDGNLGLTVRLVLLIATFIVGNALGHRRRKTRRTPSAAVVAVHRHSALRSRGLALRRATAGAAGGDHRDGHAQRGG